MNEQKEISYQIDMLIGCKNRMCVTDDLEELECLYKGLVSHATNLFVLNLHRIDNEIQ